MSRGSFTPLGGKRGEGGSGEVVLSSPNKVETASAA
jgi:hypothetical protein